MPPKCSVNKKVEVKKQEKIIEDKTFGLKNKKGAKTQKYVKMVEQQVKLGGQNARKLERTAEPTSKDKKELERQKLEELKELFKPVVEQPKTQGQDPKTMLCAFFKQGLCTRGAKCKFSHDMNSAAGANERKSEKKNLYSDDRADDTMENWDEDQLRSVVEKRHGEMDRSKPKTDIVCKYFIDAVEQKKYGFFWECPNGNDKCHYKHCLPPGFVLKSDKKAKKNEGDELTLEDLIEKERANLPASQTKITLETFQAWKERKKNEKKKEAEESSSKKKDNFKAGNMMGLSGRDLFDFNPDLIRADEDEDGEGGEIVMVERDEDDEENEEYEEEQRQRDEALRLHRAAEEGSEDEDEEDEEDEEEEEGDNDNDDDVDEASVPVNGSESSVAATSDELSSQVKSKMTLDNND